MAIQVFGTKKCKETQKAMRFFKERGVRDLQFINLKEKEMSRGEIRSVASQVGIDNMINTKSPLYEEMALGHIVYDKEEKLIEYPELIKTPVVRSGKKATVGYEPLIWKEWLK